MHFFHFNVLYFKMTRNEKWKVEFLNKIMNVSKLEDVTFLYLWWEECRCQVSSYADENVMITIIVICLKYFRHIIIIINNILIKYVVYCRAMYASAVCWSAFSVGTSSTPQHRWPASCCTCCPPTHQPYASTPANSSRQLFTDHWRLSQFTSVVYRPLALVF